jgi:glycosyltransferase involved in cell wall biosynthesis
LSTPASVNTPDPVDDAPPGSGPIAAPAEPVGEHTTRPSVLMLGKGWFPEQLGGLDRYYRDLLEHLPEARGLIVGPAPGSPDRVTAASRHDAPLPLRLLALWKAARTAGRDAQVVDAHFALYALVPMLFGRLRKLPAIVHFQGPWADENVSAGDGSKVRRRLRRGLERLVYRRADRAIVLTSAFRRVLVEKYRFSPWGVRVVPPGVDLDRFSPGDRSCARGTFALAPDAFVAVAVRRLVPRMGLDVLIEAWASGLSELPSGAQLLIAGDGPERGPLQEQIERLKIADSVRILGRISDDELVDLYRAADVGVVPTRSFEGFGLVVIEAAGCGTPTIVTEVGGLPEAVHALDSSLAVAPDDVEALTRRLVQAAAPGGLPSRDATRAFAELFSWERAVERNRGVMREAIVADPPHRRMRVVYLDHVAKLSGGEIALLRLLPHLDDVEPHVILAEDGPFADRLVQAGISTEVLPMREGARNLRKDRVTARTLPLGVVASALIYTVRVAIRLRRLRPDVVHTNSLKAGIYGSIAARLAGVPAVWHVRDRIAEDYLPRPAVRLVRAMTRRLPSVVIANSHATMATLDPQAAPVLLYSVVPEVLIPPEARAGRAPGDLVIGMIGRLAPWKGQDLLLQAFADAFPVAGATCVLVGSSMFGEDAYDAQLHALSRELGIEDRVEFRGFRDDVWQELERMDILAHASLTPEPFGQVVLEGMAAGVPVVAADTGGPAEIVQHDINGLLYPMGDRAALAAALRQLGSDPARRLRLAEFGLATVASYHPDAVVDRLQGVYRGVTNRAARRSSRQTVL